MAAVFRALNGLLNGNGAIIKTYIREITDSTNQARVYTCVQWLAICYISIVFC